MVLQVYTKKQSAAGSVVFTYRRTMQPLFAVIVNI